jgi:hypothetical protein
MKRRLEPELDFEFTPISLPALPEFVEMCPANTLMQIRLLIRNPEPLFAVIEDSDLKYYRQNPVVFKGTKDEFNMHQVLNWLEENKE